MRQKSPINGQYETFTRQLQLGDTVDVENIQASYGDGVLHLTVPITQAAQPRRVQVRADVGANARSPSRVKLKNRRQPQERPRTAVHRAAAPSDPLVARSPSARLLRQKSPINGQYDAGDEGRLIGGEEQDRLRNLARLAQSSHRMGRLDGV